ncbi:MAG: c-type cytochrome, partial [Planctomycetota bacterium]|nr:c-type cytochrome [Planctomycetota bacterium]
MWGWIAGAALALCLQDPKTQEGREADVKVLFLTNCAACHGETGDGKGWTKLDRPARSFQDGGFSYGNTPEALFRTITVGIPGTQMPGFGTSLTEQERRMLADHVITLGPEGVVVEPEDTILVVRDRPL